MLKFQNNDTTIIATFEDFILTTYVIIDELVTVHSVHSNLVKIHSKSPSVMGFCPVCLGILPYSWQNTSRDTTCEQ